MRVLAQTQARVPLRLLAFCLMPNHWHLLLWPQADDELSRFLHWLTLTHTQRWRAHYHSVGLGHLYQGRFKSIVIAADEHFLTVCRYVERNPLRAGLVDRAQDWPWSSLAQRDASGALSPRLAEWPVRRPAGWRELVNRVETEAELAALRAARPAVRYAGLGGADRGPAGSGQHPATPRPAEERARKRFLTPFALAFCLAGRECALQ